MPFTSATTPYKIKNFGHIPEAENNSHLGLAHSISAVVFLFYSGS